MKLSVPMAHPIPTVLVPTPDLERCRRIADQLLDLSMAGRIHHRASHAIRTPAEAWRHDYEAAKGECALTFYIGIPWDADRLIRGRGDAGIDLRWRGWTLQVKSLQPSARPALWMSPRADLRADLFVVTWRAPGNSEGEVALPWLLTSGDPVDAADVSGRPHSGRDGTIPQEALWPVAELRELAER